MKILCDICKCELAQDKWFTLKMYQERLPVPAFDQSDRLERLDICEDCFKVVKASIELQKLKLPNEEL